MKRTGLLLALGLCASFCGCAANGMAVIEKYQHVTPTRYEGAVAVVLEDRHHATLGETGKDGVYETYRRIKILDRKALDCGKDAPNCRLQRYFGYEPGFEQVELIEARTINPDGTIFEVKKDDMQDMTFTSWMFPEEFSRGLLYTMKGVVPGSIIEERFRSRAIKNQGLGGIWFQDRDPVLEISYTVDAPASYEYSWKTYNIDVQPTEKRVGNRIVRTWSARDLPPLIEEKGMVAYDDVVAKLMIGSKQNFGYEDVSKNTKTGTWEERGAYTVDLLKTTQDATDEVKRIATLIKKKSKTDTDKVRELWAWMNDNVRYVARKSNKFDRGVLPLSAHFVCTKKYGDCKAVGSFISVVAREMGLKADPVSIGTRGQRGAVELEVPCHQSNHMIARVEADDKVYWMDATTRTFDYKTTPYSDQGVHVVVARPGAPFVDFIPVQPPEASLSNMKTVLVPAADGSVHIDVERSTTGNFAGSLRARAYAYTPEKWNNWVESEAALVYPQVQIKEQSTLGKKDNNAPFGMKLQATIPQAMQPAGRGISLQVKELFPSKVFDYFELPKRKFALDLTNLWNRQNRYEVQIPAGMVPAGIPRNVIFEDEFLAVERLSQIENDRLVTLYSLKLKMLQIPAQKYPQARKSFQKALDASSYVVIFEPEKKKKARQVSAR